MEKSKHYVDNEKFYNAMVERKKQVDDAKDAGVSPPKVSDYIGECIMKIAVHLTHRPNFNNYSFKDDMVMDGIENCLKYIDNFDADKYDSPFSYFNRVIWQAFVRRIDKEKKGLYAKCKFFVEKTTLVENSATQESDPSSYIPLMNEWSDEYVSRIIDDFEDRKQKKKDARKQKERKKNARR